MHGWKSTLQAYVSSDLYAGLEESDYAFWLVSLSLILQNPQRFTVPEKTLLA